MCDYPHLGIEGFQSLVKNAGRKSSEDQRVRQGGSEGQRVRI